jgi:ribonuclease-3
MHVLTPKHIEWLSQWTNNSKNNFADAPSMLNAFTHPSYLGGASLVARQFEQMEFLGDAAINFFITESLCQRFPELSEGHLARLKAALVSAERLGAVMEELEVKELIFLGKGEQELQNFLAQKQLGKFFEALMAAFIDVIGFESTKVCFFSMIAKYEKNSGHPFFDLELLETFDAKSKLQNLCLQTWRVLPEYRSVVARENGKDLFSVELFVKDKLIAQAQSHSKKNAEKMAAKEAIELLQHNLNQGILC